MRAGELQQVGDGQARATLIQDDGSAYPLPGKLLFSDISVDPTTNQITLRSEFPNPDLDLLPGSYVRVRLEQAVQPKGLSVPQRAILRDSAGVPKVLVVDQQARVSDRQVVLGSGGQGDRWVVSERPEAAGERHGGRGAATRRGPVTSAGRQRIRGTSPSPSTPASSRA